jgi:hypothetical protein
MVLSLHTAFIAVETEKPTWWVLGEPLRYLIETCSLMRLIDTSKNYPNRTTGTWSLLAKRWVMSTLTESLFGHLSVNNSASFHSFLDRTSDSEPPDSRGSKTVGIMRIGPVERNFHFYVIHRDITIIAGNGMRNFLSTITSRVFVRFPFWLAEWNP